MSVVLTLLVAAACDGPERDDETVLVEPNARLLVAGIGAGGQMAQQLHFAHSALIDGVAVVGAGPYGCALGDEARARGVCRTGGRLDLATVSHAARDAAAAGDIDTLNHLADDRVWIAPGWRDSPVSDEVVFAAFELYEDFVRGDGLEFVERCDGDAASCGPELARSLIGHLLPADPPTTVPDPVAPAPVTRELEAVGPWQRVSATIPPGCERGHCDLLLLLGSCDGAADAFAGALDGIAAGHSLVVVHVDAASSTCWDWWGAQSADYRSRNAPQIAALHGLLSALGARPAGVGSGN